MFDWLSNPRVGKANTLVSDGGVDEGPRKTFLYPDGMEAGGEDCGHDVGAFFACEGCSDQWVLNGFHDGRSKAVPGIRGAEGSGLEGVGPYLCFGLQIVFFSLHGATGA